MDPRYRGRRFTSSILRSSRSKRQHTDQGPAGTSAFSTNRQSTRTSESPIILNGGRDIDAGSMVDVRGGSLITENIPRRIGIERTRILALRITDFGAP